MRIKSIAKKLLPKKIKDQLKREIGSTTEYVLNVTNTGRLTGKTAIVTGGSGAIGSAICLRLAMEGAVVDVCGRSIDKVNKVMSHSGKTDDVAGTVALLVSEYMNYITGQNMVVDGGHNLGLWGDI